MKDFYIFKKKKQPEGEWFCSMCRPTSRTSAGRRQTQQSRIARVTPEQQRQNEEKSVIENAWRHFDLLSATSSPPTTTKIKTTAEEQNKTSATGLLRSMESATKNVHRRLTFIPNLVHTLQVKRSTSFCRDLFENGFLSHLRGWFQLSLDSPERDSVEERHFRFVLLQQVDGMKEFITKEHLKTSRLNKAMMRCSSEDTSGQNRKLATDLFDTFCHALGSTTARTDLTREEQPPPPSSNKRPRVMVMRRKIS